MQIAKVTSGHLIAQYSTLGRKLWLGHGLGVFCESHAVMFGKWCAVQTKSADADGDGSTTSNLSIFLFLKPDQKNIRR